MADRGDKAVRRTTPLTNPERLAASGASLRRRQRQPETAPFATAIVTTRNDASFATLGHCGATLPEHPHTPVTFSREEMAEISAMLAKSGKPPTCPRCDGKLEVQGLIDVSLGHRFYVACDPCAGQPLSMSKLAEKVGCIQATISNLETGKSQRIELDLDRLADALDCEIADLVVRTKKRR